MSNSESFDTCRLICWALAAIIGLVVLVSVVSATGFLVALLIGVALAVLLGLAATRIFCTGGRILSSDDAAASAASSAGTVRDHAAGAAEAAKSKAAEAAKATEEKAESAARAAEEKASETVETVRGKAQEAVGATGSGDSEDKDEEAPKVASGTVLDGEEELAERKGEWRYEGGDGSGSGASATDGDHAGGGEREGRRPAALEAARGGQPDDLKQIKGVGPKLEQMLNGMGFYHFDQIAAWDDEEVAWVDGNIKGFKGRVSRDGWVEQAKVLAAGGETEFSKRVGDGDVY